MSRVVARSPVTRIRLQITNTILSYNPSPIHFDPTPGSPQQTPSNPRLLLTKTLTLKSAPRKENILIVTFAAVILAKLTKNKSIKTTDINTKFAEFEVGVDIGFGIVGVGCGEWCIGEC